MEIDEDLKSLVAFDERSKEHFIWIRPLVGVPSVEQVSRALDAGIKTLLTNLEGSEDFDLNVYSDAISRVSNLRVMNPGSGSYKILEKAEYLETLSLRYPGPSEYLDLSGLPNLRDVSIYNCQNLQSIFANPHLTDISIFGSNTSGIPLLHGPVESLFVHDFRAVSELPELARPEKLVWFRLDNPRRFDAASLLRAVNLETFQVGLVGVLENVWAFSKLEHLRELILDRATSREDWDLLLDCKARVARMILTPSPSKKLRTAAVERGWNVWGKHDDRSLSLMPFDLLEPEDEDDLPVLHLDEFNQIENLIQQTLGENSTEELLINGYFVEDLVVAACSMSPDFSNVELDCDSEAEGTYIGFPNKKLARKAVKLTLTLLANKTELTELLKKIG